MALKNNIYKKLCRSLTNQCINLIILDKFIHNLKFAKLLTQNIS